MATNLLEICCHTPSLHVVSGKHLQDDFSFVLMSGTVSGVKDTLQKMHVDMPNLLDMDAILATRLVHRNLHQGTIVLVEGHHDVLSGLA